MLACALIFGLLSSFIYVFPHFLKEQIGFHTLRPFHVSYALLWIILGATGCVYCGLNIRFQKLFNQRAAMLQWLLWLIAFVGITYSYLIKDFGGREYWEFNPKWALPIALAWILFLFNFFSIALKIKNWPVYLWMWMTGILFFLFAFTENYLWLFPYFREHFITDMTIQWKVNGSLVGAWNQLLYGTAFFVMDRISGTKDTGKSKLAFAMYFLGLFNLMFNWGHHIYTLPTSTYIKYVGYAVSMTEWVFFIKIIYNWRSSLSDVKKHYHYFPYRFIMASDFWVFVNMGQAILMSIPALNIYTHGTHVTVAHAMGTTIGINTMIILAFCFEYLYEYKTKLSSRVLPIFFWILQGSLLLFYMSLNIAGLKKGQWQLSDPQIPFSMMMQSLQPYFILFIVAGVGILIALSIFIFVLLKNSKVFR